MVNFRPHKLLMTGTLIREIGGVPNLQGRRAMGEESSLPGAKSVAIKRAMVSFLRY